MKKAMKQSTMTRLLNGATIVLSITTILCFIATVTSYTISNKANENRFQLTLNANRFMDASSYLTTQVRAYSTTGNPEFYDNYWNEVNTAKNREAGVSNMQAIGITPAEQQKIDEMSSLSNNLVPLEDNAMQMVQKGQQTAAIEYVFGNEYQSTVNKINTAKTEFLEMLNQRTAADLQRLRKQGVVLQLVTGVQILACIVLQIIVLLFVDKRLIRPIVAIKNEMEKIATGNLSAPFSLKSDASEIGTLIQSIISTKATLNTYIQDISAKLETLASGNMHVTVETEYIGDFAPIQIAIIKITSSLNATLFKIRKSAERVQGSSNQVSAESQSLAQGAAEQSSAIEALTSSVEDIAAKIRQNADDLQNAQQKSLHTSEAISRSNSYMQSLLTAMDRITKYSKEINKIIKTIDDIAFQTNILALNAAVESARAGNAGKGFAVVADEVRNLAGKSAAAANDTVQLINDTVTAVVSGTKLANQTAEELSFVVTDAMDTSKSIEEVSSASNEQAKLIEEICNVIEQISSVVQSNTSTSEESAAAAEELYNQANTMDRLVKQFSLQELKE